MIIVNDPEIDKSITLIDKKVALLVFNSYRLNVSENSYGGKAIGEMLHVYQRLLKTGLGIEHLEDLLEVYYPSTPSRSFRRPSQRSVQVGAGRKANIARKRLLHTEGSQVANVANRLAMDEASKSLMERIENSERESREARQIITHVAESIATLTEEQRLAAQQQEENTNHIVQTQRGMFNNLRDLIGGRVTLSSIFANGIASALKWLLLTAISIPIGIAKFIYWDTWVYPIKMALKKLASKTVWIGGVILIVAIGGIWYAQVMTSNHPEYLQMCPSIEDVAVQSRLYGPDTQYCSFTNIGWDVLDRLSRPYFELEWSFSSVLTFGREVAMYANPPMVLLVKGRQAYMYIGKMYGDWLYNFIVDMASTILRDASRDAKDAALNKIKSYFTWRSQ